MAVAEPVEVGIRLSPQAPRPAQVLVRRVDDRLGVGQRMHGGDRAMADADALVEHLDQRRQAVGGAGGGADHAVHRRVEALVVDADHHVQCASFLDRRGDHHPGHALVQVGLQQRLLPEFPGGLDHDVAAGPVAGVDVAVGGDRNAASIDDDCIALAPDVAAPAPLDRVELEQVGEGGGIGARIVDLHVLQVRRIEAGAQRQPADAAEAVDADPGLPAGTGMGQRHGLSFVRGGAQAAASPPQQFSVR
jgi:hypothetical protein